MIQLKISGRAGNQFFQYAFVKKYLNENNIKQKLYISFEHLEKHKTDENTFKNDLSDFKVDDFEVIEKIKMTKKQKRLDFLYKIFLKFLIINAKLKNRSLVEKDYVLLKKVLQRKLNINGLYYYIPTMDTVYESKVDNIIFYGSFENNDFFKSHKEEIKKMYEPKEKELKKNIDLYKIIENSNSICVTIRRGDFLNPEFKKKYYICNEKYFENGIKKMKTLVKNPQFVIFSDDVEWCKKNIKLPNGTLFESGSDPIWEKIRLMYSCKHFIISNSTFSWWAQYLSKNENKIVIAPNKWNNFEYCDLIYDDKWILI